MKGIITRASNPSSTAAHYYPAGGPEPGHAPLRPALPPTPRLEAASCPVPLAKAPPAEPASPAVPAHGEHPEPPIDPLAAGPASPAAPASADLPASLAEVRYLTVAEMATALRISKITVYRLIHEGELAALRIGRDFRIPVSAALAYLKSC